MKVYLAGPLFSEAEQRWCCYVRDRLGSEAGVEVNWPFDSVVKLNLEGKNPAEVQKIIAEDCKQGVKDCDILVVLLDTIPTDDGTAFELGYLVGLGYRHVPVVGLRTDVIRTYGDSAAPLNAMVGAHVTILCKTVDELVKAIQRFGRRPSC